MSRRATLFPERLTVLVMALQPEESKIAWRRHLEPRGYEYTIRQSPENEFLYWVNCRACVFE